MMAANRRGPEVYRQRIERALARGLSRSAARGHAKLGEATASGRLAKADPRLTEGFAMIADGRSLSAAAKQLRISRERLRRSLSERGDYVRQGRRHVFVPRVSNDLPLYSDGNSIRVLVDDEEAARLGAFMSAVGKFWRSNITDHLAPFVSHGVTDLRGKFHPFETDPEALYVLRAKGRPEFHQIYRQSN